MKYSAIFFILLSSLFFFSSSCSDKESKTAEAEQAKGGNAKKKKKKSKDIAKLISPKHRAKIKEGEIVPIQLELKDSTISIDSVRFFLDGEWLFTKSDAPFVYEWDAEGSKMGQRNFIAVVHKSDSTREGHNVRVDVFPSTAPTTYVYQVINDYPHDDKAFTQGLVYHDGYLLEGTGHKGASSLRKVDVRTGKIVKISSMPDQFFGEGIALFGDEIFQLTWQSQSGFVYDKNTFQQKREFRYPTEGWGLTTVGDKLLMSDGSNILYYLDPKSFTELSRLEVYDNNGPVKQLNELEYIEGEIWANVWETDFIVRIDPKTGKVVGKINLGGILDRRKYTGQVDVLNGIAYDPVMKRIFVTGKHWPRLFQIRVLEKK
ncbi:glutaminyl-peptide cyclotransferase [Flammeovirgaceae bacterium SG7u.111]|nr:glutaminyl-peptide cyclotransferase [Flammeovirgaceae bacterium SG7u.132]WPO37942.1 glutaminyl-peptide cyclotransferase [Flammeovirgaceae bacterium SG7u.111]